MQLPPIAAMTGLVEFSITSITAGNEGSADMARLPNSLMSAPAENPASVPIKTTALIAASLSAR